jgi:SUF system FeS cluster assembly, SufBD
VPFIYMADGLPRHDSINSFRKRFLARLEERFVQLLLIALSLGVLKLGDIVVDGSKVKANASKHKTMKVLQIYADDVKSSHGATVGQLDENAVFYLRTHGIDKETARSLLIYAFADAVLSRISLALIRTRLERILNQAGACPGCTGAHRWRSSRGPYTRGCPSSGLRFLRLFRP